jgi:glycosyltransferase involved in cell wall biosynthesis
MSHAGATDRPLRFVFITTTMGWGGSEELWSGAAAVLAERGHAVTAYIGNVPHTNPRIRRLKALGCRLRSMGPAFLPRRLYWMVSRYARLLTWFYEAASLWLSLVTGPRPDLVLISQTGNYDGLIVAVVCNRLRLPFSFLSQKAADIYWPSDGAVRRMRPLYLAARACFFVSAHNHRLTEEQMGVAIPHGRVVRNPFLVPWPPREDWPDEEYGLKLACVARLSPADKGQDILLRVLARPKWRERPLTVTFYGDGPQRESLKGMAAFLELRSVDFAGLTGDIVGLWARHHGLVLCSRAEGLPLVVVEAMLSGRVPIVTDAGGNREVIGDGLSGYIAEAASEDAFDAALERAWADRANWREVGQRASAKIRELVPADPAAAFADILLETARDS